MLDSLGKRGPDGRGVWVDPDRRVVLGHTRLSIIDVEGSAQPLSNEDGTVWVTFNGEIYNYLELRQELLARGHEFRTRGDTEVLVHLYEEHGVEMVSLLDGIFAFAIYDTRKKQLLLARDRVGVKPLYFWHHPPSGDLVFGSFLPTLLAHPRVPREHDPRALAQYLQFGYIVPPGTWLKGVEQLSPGESLVHSYGMHSRTRYYQWEYRPDEELAKPGVALSTLEEVLAGSVKSQLVADVSVGTFLSGGIDSSVVTALAQRHRRSLGQTVNSYSVKFWVAQLDESARSGSIARDLGTSHHVLQARQMPLDRETLDEVVRGLGEPFGDDSSLAMFFLCREASSSIKVALSGDGGDELFFGYGGMRKQRIAELFRQVPAWIRRACVAQGKDSEKAFFRRLAKYSALAQHDDIGLLGEWHRRWSLGDMERMLEPGVYAGLFPEGEHTVPEVREILEARRPRNLAECQLAFYMLVNLPGDNLLKVDRMSMAHGVEVRVPLLSNGMLKYAEELPIKERRALRRSKEPLRSLGESLCPTLRIPDAKRGFGFPLADWFGERLAVHWKDWAVTERLAGFGFRREPIDQLVADFTTVSRTDHRYQQNVLAVRLYHLLVLALWADGVKNGRP